MSKLAVETRHSLIIVINISYVYRVENRDIHINI